ncbi:MAG: hypothetical protein NW207_00040 [Cytophagales bacterium]|nr:hypothetical protein [Cytophagales bacterium]
MNSKVIFFIVYSLICIIYFVFAIYKYPLLGNDAYNFLPGALMYNINHEMVNHFSEVAKWFDPQYHRYIYYPPLYTIVISKMLIFNDMNGLYIAIYMLFILNITSMAVVIHISAKSALIKSNKNFIYIIGSFFLLCFASAIEYSLGRPEILATLIITNIIASYLCVSKKLKFFIIGALMSCLLFTQLIATLIVGLIIVYFIIFISNNRFLDSTLFAAGILAGSILVVFFLLPYSISDYFIPICNHIKYASGIYYFDLFGIKFYHIINNHYAFVILWIFISIYYILRRHNNNITVNKYQTIYTITLLAFVFYIWFKNLHAAYTIFLFLPLSIVFIIQNLVYNKNTIGELGIIIFVCILTTASFGRKVVNFYQFIDKKGITYEQFDSIVGKITDTIPLHTKIGVSESLWPRFIKYNNVTITTHLQTSDSSIKYLFFQQANYSKSTPDSIAGYSLLFCNYINTPNQLFGVKIGSSIPGYQTAIYKKK